MKEKIVIITGANSGIGKDATLKFAKKGYTIIMACRSIERSKPVLNEIISASGNEKVFLSHGYSSLTFRPARARRLRRLMGTIRKRWMPVGVH